jgi:dTDP-4-amino-4,6-dideoxygalactose transaminase
MPPLSTIADALRDAIADGSWAAYRGENVPALEAALAAAFRVNHVHTCASGTLAVEIALRAAGVGPGDEVAQAAYDYDGNFLSIHAIGATPVLVDVDPVSGQLDIDRLAEARSPKLKAVLASHLHGGLVPMARLMAWAKPLGIVVVEDAAQAPGATVDGRPAGSHGDFGILSFGGSKLLSAGRGGAVLTSDTGLSQKVKLLLHRGVQAWAAISELQAIVLRPQVAALPAETDRRLAAVRALLPTLPDSLAPLADLDGRPAFYKVGFRFAGPDREAWCRAMRDRGLPFDPGFAALHVGRSPRRFRAASDLRHAETLGRECVVLHHSALA